MFSDTKNPKIVIVCVWKIIFSALSQQIINTSHHPRLWCTVRHGPAERTSRSQAFRSQPTNIREPTPAPPLFLQCDSPPTSVNNLTKKRELCLGRRNNIYFAVWSNSKSKVKTPSLIFWNNICIFLQLGKETMVVGCKWTTEAFSSLCIISTVNITVHQLTEMYPMSAHWDLGTVETRFTRSAVGGRVPPWAATVSKNRIQSNQVSGCSIFH